MRQPEVKNSADKHLTFERNSSSNKRQYLPNLCRCWYFLKKVNVELSLRTFLLEISPKAGVFFIVFIDLNLVIIVLSLFCCRKEVWPATYCACAGSRLDFKLTPAKMGIFLTFFLFSFFRFSLLWWKALESYCLKIGNNERVTWKSNQTFKKREKWIQKSLSKLETFNNESLFTVTNTARNILSRFPIWPTTKGNDNNKATCS